MHRQNDCEAREQIQITFLIIMGIFRISTSSKNGMFFRNSLHALFKHVGLASYLVTAL